MQTYRTAIRSSAAKLKLVTETMNGVIGARALIVDPTHGHGVLARTSSCQNDLEWPLLYLLIASAPSSAEYNA